MHFLTRNDLEEKTATRQGEIKLGQVVETITSWNDLSNKDAHFVVLGICEDIGIRANLGIGSASHSWDLALKALLNTQSNRYLKGEDILIAGKLTFEELLNAAKGLDSKNPNDLAQLRNFTSKIDEEVEYAIHQIVKAGKVPIIIGGGHNNAYGNICGTSNALAAPINVLNIDPHTDFRALEGRHSGNGFSYAKEAGKLDRYAVYGLHEGYNAADILEEFYKKKNLFSQSFESLLWANNKERDAHFKNVLNWLSSERIGLELDMDSITHFPVSAANPSGFTLNEIRNMIRAAAALKSPYYFHICEGSPDRTCSEMQKDMLGKSIAYLITDFVKTFS